MPRTRLALFRFVQESARAVAAAIGAISLTPDQRTLYKGKWSQNAFEFGQRAAQCRDRHASYLSDIPYGGADIRDAFQDADDAEAYFIQLQRLCRSAADSVLKKRARAYGLAHGILLRMQALLDNPILDEQDRLDMEASLRRLRKELDRKDETPGPKRRRKPRPATAPRKGAELPEVPDVVETRTEPAPRALEGPRKARAAGKSGRGRKTR
jgi:hypothetical protein